MMSGPVTLRPEFLIRDTDQLRALFPPTHDIAVAKVLDRLDHHARAFIARSPFLCIGTQGPTGTADSPADVSPRGDPPGFVRVLDDRTLAIPDRPGNNRLDTLANIVANPVVGLLFLIPGYDETLRVNGRASVTRDPDLLATLAVHDRRPTVAIVVAVDEVFLHCAKAFRRSRLWDPDARQDRAAMPSLVQMILDQTTGAPTDPAEIARNDAALEDDYRRTMY
jgi:PPOX class probable FMN-dependent enzyme